mgnify:CR=1 FL=1
MATRRAFLHDQKTLAENWNQQKNLDAINCGDTSLDTPTHRNRLQDFLNESVNLGFELFLLRLVLPHLLKVLRATFGFASSPRDQHTHVALVRIWRAISVPRPRTC